MVLNMVRNLGPEPYAAVAEWWEPEVPQDGGRLSDEQLLRWIETGFLLLEGLWPEGQLRKAMTEARELHPPEGVLAGTHGHHVEMPWVERGDEAPDMALNHMSLQPAVLQVVAQLLRTPVANLRLAQNLVSAKVGRRLEADPEGGGEAELDGDQPIHVRPADLLIS